LKVMGEPAVRSFDFHCHLDLDKNPAETFKRCASERIIAIAVTTTPKAWRQNLAWAAGNPFVHVAAGLHPELVQQRYAELPLLEACIAESRFVGEVGLDGSPQHRSSYGKQVEVFDRALRAANSAGGRVITIHSRRAVSDVLAALERRVEPARVLPILHWFSGPPADLKRAAATGCFFSVNAAMLENDRGRKLVAAMPVDRLLTETDSPFTLVDGRPSVPWDVMGTLSPLASVRGMSAADMRQVLLDNANRVLTFAGCRLPA
jgi:TatD DNase family protein